MVQNHVFRYVSGQPGLSGTAKLLDFGLAKALRYL
jgi:hypothetical protein